MARSRPFVLFIWVLCLVACVCAHGDVSDAEATKAIEAARDSAQKVFNDVKSDIRTTGLLRSEINTYKINAEEAATKAEKAANGISEAEIIAQKAKKASAAVLQLYPNASGLAEKYLDTLKKLRTQAQELDNKANNDLYISRYGVNNYTKIKEDADFIKSQVEALKTEYNKELSSFSGVYAIQNEMLEFVSSAQLARYHVDVFIAVAKIDTLLESAESDIKIMEQKRNEINATLQEMKNLDENSPEKLSHFIQSLCSNTADKFYKASKNVEEAKKAKECMLEQKSQANDVLMKVKDETEAEKAKDGTEVKKAKDEAGVVDKIAKKAENNLEEIKKALESATISAINALSYKETAVNELNSNTKKPDVTQDNEKTNSQDSLNTHQPVEDTTESSTVIGTKKPKITSPDQSKSEQPVQDTTESSTVIGTKKPTITSPDQSKSEQPVQDTTESSTVIGTKKPTITSPDQSKSEQPVQDTTESSTVIGTKKPTITSPDQSKSEQPVQDTTESSTVIGTKKPTITKPDQPGSGGTEPTQSSSSDSATTVSVPLLLTLIACAALH